MREDVQAAAFDATHDALRHLVRLHGFARGSGTAGSGRPSTRAEFRPMFVATIIGQSTCTPSPWGFSSRSNDSDRATTANFVTQ